jgi:hypothetical protein
VRGLTVRSDDELRILLFEQSGVLSRAQALKLFPHDKLRNEVRSGRWTRPHHGVYLSHNGPITPLQRLWIASLAAGHGEPAPVAGSTSLVAHGMRSIDDQRIHVLVPAPARDMDPPSGVVVHRTSHLPELDLMPSRPPRTSPPRAVVDAAQWARTDTVAREIVAAAFQQRLVSWPAIAAVLDRMRRAKRRALVIETALAAVGGAESIPEQDFVRLCRRSGLPTPSLQTVVIDADGRRRYRDAYFAQWRIHVEIDGAQHIDVRAWWADMQRQNAMWTRGDRVLRFPAWAIKHAPDDVVATVRSALMAAGWRPPAF